jgi:serine/threonine protein kinase
MDPASWREAKDVISEALKLPASERDAFVRARCRDPRLSDDIIAMLSGFSEGNLAAVPIPVDDDTGDDDLEPGTRIGPYVILDRIGRGGMGQVFLGSDPRLQRKVALKCVIRSLTGSSDRTLRILHEARAAARVNHPNVATVHDVVEHENRAFIVMEYVEGETLSSRLKRERLTIEQTIAIGRQLASALAAAHAKGVVHRDLKPGNVQLTPDGTAKVLDFGIANAPRATLTASTTATTQGGVQTTVRTRHPGTPPYMSPEQLLGRVVDARSDLYSLGVVLCEMATGQRLFTDADPLLIVVAQARGVPRADTIDRRVPRALADVIEKALAIDVRARFQTAAEVASALAVVERQLEKRREPLRRRLARGAVALAIAPVVFAIIGFLNTTAFNLSFGRTGTFASQSASTYVSWGLRAMFPSAVIMTLAAVVVLTLRFACGLLLLMPAVNRFVARVRTTRVVATLESPVVLAQTLAAAAAVALVLESWHRWDLISAWGALINTAPAQSLLPLDPAHVRARGWYRTEIDLLVLAFSYGLYRVQVLRAQLKVTDGLAPVVMLTAIIGVFVLMNEWPYRVFYYNEFEAIDFAGARCYVTGQTDAQMLVFCPGAGPPRNRIVPNTDPRVHRLGVVENVFKGLNVPQSGS